jgi:hypothetical protein
MAFKSGDIGGEINLGTDAWNVANGYTQLKILRQLVMLDRWDTMAQFGTEEIDEDRLHSQNQINKRRVEGLQRFHSTEKQLLGNVIFAMKKRDVQGIKDMIKRVENVEEFINRCYAVKEDLVNHEEEFEIKEDLFKKIINILQEVKNGLNIPLNNAGLIFRQSEEMDLDKIMAGIIEGG